MEYTFFINSTCTPGGIWSSESNMACKGRFVMSGDPHFRTFDSRYFTFDGKCTYVLVEPARDVKMKLPFSIYLKNDYCRANDDAVCTKSISIQIGDRLFR